MTNFADKTIQIGGVPHYLERAASPTTSGVLLIPHVYGIDEFIRGFAAEIAAHGHTTLVFNPYPGLAFGEKFTDRPARPKDGDGIKAFSACVDVMIDDLGLTSIATTGFCMGARYILVWAGHEPRLRAAAPCYPSVPAELNPGQDVDPVAAAGTIRCPVHLVYPGRDRVTPRPVFERIQAQLEAREVETVVSVYPHAEHGFMHLPDDGVNSAATKRARPQVMAYLDSYLSID